MHAILSRGRSSYCIGLDGSGGATPGSGLAAPAPILAAIAKYVATNTDE
jgi:hypothetical protein